MMDAIKEMTVFDLSMYLKDTVGIPDRAAEVLEGRKGLPNRLFVYLK